MIKMYIGFHVTYPLLNFLDRVLQNTHVLSLVKIHPVVAELLHPDSWTDRET
jgi:hypothetical protein